MKPYKIAKTGMRETVTCKECGETEELCWFPEVNERLKTQSLCFSCDHWTHYVETDSSNPNALVIEGRHYIVGDEDRERLRAWRGFAGQKFNIEKFTGEQIETTNLWHQGKIPQHFKDRLPDNANFIDK